MSVDVSVINSQASIHRMNGLVHAPDDVEKVASDFEAMCYASMVKEMFKTTEDSAIWGESHASGILRSMFIEVMANAGGSSSLNIKKAVAKSLYNTEENRFTNPAFESHSTEEKREAVDVLL
ncbi:MAG: hypothetical protein ACK4V2_02525 [Pseudomonadota bacterium]|jgi:Rod binding domain-containing protein|nr:hypothetical protein [Alphaproteobacteria bacterium]